jgi:hypothetical protein
MSFRWWQVRKPGFVELCRSDGCDSENGPVVRPGDAEHSLLYEAVSRPAIEQSILSTRMPQGLEPLSAMQIKLIEDWINEGAIDN